MITEGWVMYLDDDDLFNNPDSVTQIVNGINNNDEDTVIYWKMIFNGGAIPNVINKDNPPKLYNIGSPCFTYNHKYLSKVKWDGWKCADFRFINNLHNKIPKFDWLDKELILIPNPGLGNKKDI